MSISDWSTNVCSSDLNNRYVQFIQDGAKYVGRIMGLGTHAVYMEYAYYDYEVKISYVDENNNITTIPIIGDDGLAKKYMYGPNYVKRSDEHTSELQSLLRITYAVFCLKTKNRIQTPA